ncbi:MAG: hypothetical protein ACJ8C4_06825 [Gemmataceae bacterium]
MKSLLGFLCALCVLCGSTLAASPRDELLKLVPSDAGFVVVVQDLRGQINRLREGPFAKKFLQTASGKALLSDGVAKEMATADQLLSGEIGLPWAKIRDDLLGDAIVFVYRPGPTDKPEDEEGIALLYARDPNSANIVLEHLDAAEKKAGKLTSVTTVTHNGKSYRKRVRKGESDEFLYQRGPLVAVGSGEALIRQIIDADRDEATGEPDLAKQLRELNVATASVVWWINPRAFDAGIETKLKKARGTEASVQTAFARHWKALDGIAVFFDPSADLKLGIAISARPDALPPATRVFLQELSKPSALLASFPEDALITVAGRFALPSLLEAGANFLPDDTRKDLRNAARRTVGAALGSDVMSELPNHMGPDWGVCVTAPSREEQWPAVTAAVRLDDAQPPVAPRVLDGVQALATVAIVGYNVRNPDAITQQTERQGEVEVRYFVNDMAFPKGLKPAFAWKGGFLVFASSPECVRRFNPPKAEPSGSDAPLLRVAIRGWASYLRERKDDAAKFMAAHEAGTADEAKVQLDSMLEMLDLFDGLDLTLKSEARRATLTLRLRTTAPLQ